MLSAILAILGAIGTTALMMGASEFSDRAQDLKANAKGMTSDQIIGRTQALLRKARTTNQALYNQIQNRINNMPYGYIFSGHTSSKLAEARKGLSDRIDDVERKMMKIDDTMNRAQNFANMPSSYKNSAVGQADWESIERSISNVQK